MFSANCRMLHNRSHSTKWCEHMPLPAWHRVLPPASWHMYGDASMKVHMRLHNRRTRPTNRLLCTRSHTQCSTAAVHSICRTQISDEMIHNPSIHQATQLHTLQHDTILCAHAASQTHGCTSLLGGRYGAVLHSTHGTCALALHVCTSRSAQLPQA